jgi:hypothetical protein
MTPELSAHMIRFMNDPTSRTYVFTYPAGQKVCEAYVGGDPERFRHLLTDQVRIGELLDSVGDGDDRVDDDRHVQR